MKTSFYVPLTSNTTKSSDLENGSHVPHDCVPLGSSEEVAFHADLRFPSEYKKLKSYTLNWHTRLVFEAQASPCMFITFTFDNEYYFVDDPDEEVRKENLKKCWKDFIKRFRRNCEYRGIDTKSFKYYVVSERGDDGRLHFHALFFGFHYEAFASKNAKGQRVLYVKFNQITDLIEKSWGFGFLVFEAAVSENINYVTKYLHKRRISGDYISLKSNRIGLAFLDDCKIKFFKDTDVQYYHIGRKKYFLPRYLKKKIWTDPEEYKEMNIRLSKRIDEEELRRVQSKDKQNRHYVIYEDSDSIIRSALRATPDDPILYKSESTNFILPEIKDLLDRSLGFVYDPDDDSIQVYLCYDEPDLLKWSRLRTRTNENFKMKYVYNLRL